MSMACVLESLMTGTRQGLMRALALDLGAGPANASARIHRSDVRWR